MRIRRSPAARRVSTSTGETSNGKASDTPLLYLLTFFRGAAVVDKTAGSACDGADCRAFSTAGQSSDRRAGRSATTDDCRGFLLRPLLYDVARRIAGGSVGPR